MDIIFGVITMYLFTVCICVWCYAAAGGEFTFEK